MSPRRGLLLLGVTLVLAGGLYLGLRWAGLRANAPLPDLQFSAFVQAEPWFPVTGESATLTALVENEGEGAFEGSFRVAGYARDPRKGDGGEPVATGYFEGRIESGERANVTFPFEAPAQPAQLELYFAIDPDGELRELSRENNVVMSPIRVVSPPETYPDLAVEEIRFEPPAPRQNQDLVIVAVVENRGEAATPGAPVVDLYVNDPIGPKPRLPGSYRLRAPVLGAGESAEVSARVRFEEPQLVGVYAQVNTDLDISESNRTNNISGPAIVAVGSAEQHGAPDLVVDAAELEPPTPVVGSTSHLRVRIANRGGADTTSPFSVNVTFDPKGGRGPGFPSRDENEPSWSRDLRFLAAGQSFELPPVPIPFTRIGTWIIEVEVDPYDEVPEADGEGNNVHRSEVRVGAPR